MTLSLSYNWLKEYVKTAKSAKEFARELSLSGPSVDRVIEPKSDFDKVVVGQIEEINHHPDADKLQVCRVNIGKPHGIKNTIPRGEESLQIVCGAPNIAVGQKVPVVLVGGKVGDMAIKKAKIRGVESSGMMCSQQELGLGEDHSGIFILPDYVQVGLPLTKVMPTGDSILEIEVTANRPDAMSVIGLAREAAAILDEKFLYKEPQPNLKIHQLLKLSVAVKEKKLCPRYQAVVMSGVKVGPSPLWMQQRLLSAGLRPINNLVDITNYILLEFGQPMHVFDYDKLAGQEINVRLAKKGDRILALDSKTYELVPTNLVIADANGPVAIAGVMGGELSAAAGATKNIVLESANFDSVSVRKTARLLNLHSDSSSLYEKGLSPEGTLAAIKRAVELVRELAGGALSSEILDERAAKYKAAVITLRPESVTRFLGVEIKMEKIKTLLAGLGFTVKADKKDLIVAVPWWRSGDVANERDLIEEIARLYGYHHLPAQLMSGVLPTEILDQTFNQEDKAKDILASFGFSENYNYSFISEKLIKDCSLEVKNHLQLANPLSADFEYMRTSLLPGLLQSATENQNQTKEIKIFELSKIYLPRPNDLPLEQTSLVLLDAGPDQESTFLFIKGALSALLTKINVSQAVFVAENQPGVYWQANATANITVNGKNIGCLGLISSDTLQSYGLKKAVAAAEIDFAAIISATAGPSYQPLAKFPDIELDLSMEIDSAVPYQAVTSAVSAINPRLKNISFLSVFEGDRLPSGKKALAIRLTYGDDSKTLTMDEAQQAHQQVVDKLKKEYNIKVR